jgi:hypothetical protein
VRLSDSVWVSFLPKVAHRLNQHGMSIIHAGRVFTAAHHGSTCAHAHMLARWITLYMHPPAKIRLDV